MKIKVMDEAFGMEVLSAIVERYVCDPQSDHIKPEEVVSALYAEQEESGILRLFQRCTQRFNDESACLLAGTDMRYL